MLRRRQLSDEHAAMAAELRQLRSLRVRPAATAEAFFEARGP